jgi:hypothetical protein
VGARHGEPLARLGGLDRAGAPSHRLDGVQGRGRDPVSSQRGEQQRDRSAGHQQRPQVVERLTPRFQRRADDDHGAHVLLSAHRRGQQAGLVACQDDRAAGRAARLGRDRQRRSEGARRVEDRAGCGENLRDVALA